MPISVAECKVMAVAFGIVDRTRISHNLTGRFSYWLQAAETLSVVPGPNERVSRATILLIIRLSSFDPVKNKWFARWPLLWRPKDDVAFAILAEPDWVPSSRQPVYESRRPTATMRFGDRLPESLLTRGAEHGPISHMQRRTAARDDDSAGRTRCGQQWVLSPLFVKPDLSQPCHAVHINDVRHAVKDDH